MGRKEDLEAMSIEELKQELTKINKKSGFQPKKAKYNSDGAILLDPNNKRDME